MEGGDRRWSHEALGAFRIVATAKRSDGTRVESAPVRIETTYEGALLQQWWYRLAPGSRVELLTRDPRYPDAPDDETLLGGSLRNPDCFGGDHKGRRIMGFLIPPMDGTYDFGLISDDASEVWLSTDATPGNKRKIMEIADGWVDDGQWDRYPGQKAVGIPLRQGQRYYIEILHRQDWGGELLQLGWRRPDGVQERPIPIRHFIPLRMPEPFLRRMARLAAPLGSCPLDGIDDATVAYATRRLRTAYNGPLVELRRADGAVKAWLPDGHGWLSNDSPAVGGGETLGAWRGTGAVRVVVWFDQSGGDRHARAPDRGVEPALEGDGPFVIAFKDKRRLHTPELTTGQWAGPGRHDTVTIVATCLYRSGTVLFQAEFPQGQRIGFESEGTFDYPNGDKGRLQGWRLPFMDRLQVATFLVRRQDRAVRLNQREVAYRRSSEGLMDATGFATFGAQRNGGWDADAAFGELILIPRALDMVQVQRLEASQAVAFGVVP